MEEKTKERTLQHLEAEIIWMSEQLQLIPKKIEKLEELRELIKKENGNN